MKIVNFLTLLVISVLVFTSCNNEESIGQPTLTAGEGWATIKLKNASTGTRAGSQAGTAQESDIKTLEFYIFESNGNRDTTTDEDGNTKYRYVAVNELSPNNEYTFGVTAGDGKTVLVVANRELGRLDGCANITQVRKQLLDEQITDPLDATFTDGIPMAGEAKGVNVAAETTQRVEIALSRTYTKIQAPDASAAQVELDVKEYEKLEELFGGAINGEIRFKLKSYYVVNGIKDAFAFTNYGVASEYDRWDAAVWTLGGNINNYVASQYDSSKQLVSAYSGTDFLVNKDVYVYENSPKKGVYNDLGGFQAGSVYALIIKGELADDDNTIERYWRINISKTNEYQARFQILRNAIYQTSIQKVRTIGEESPEEGENGGGDVIPDEDQAGIIAEISVADWRIFNEGTDI